ncbi:serine/arginine repetitive matrix protein 1-like [Eucalyptus grandis]|uniref:serine/arginine repetitive matrix protein 1-like n=1 Tax=Eucalyptus grandis TaxID=71139 RepID=UPI00192E9178|nr:serine/arginine repetitive matrix protein 1-like [Eucalyptus grandis]
MTSAGDVMVEAKFKESLTSVTSQLAHQKWGCHFPLVSIIFKLERREIGRETEGENQRKPPPFRPPSPLDRRHRSPSSSPSPSHAVARRRRRRSSACEASRALVVSPSHRRLFVRCWSPSAEAPVAADRPLKPPPVVARAVAGSPPPFPPPVQPPFRRLSSPVCRRRRRALRRRLIGKRFRTVDGETPGDEWPVDGD